MPVIRLADAIVERPDPSNSDPELGTYWAALFSDTGGLTQFGAFLEVLPPGSKSSHQHWHECEDEFVYMLEGEVVLLEGDTETVMRPGDAATFKAGVALGHRLENRSTADARYLVVGTRSQNDIVHYSTKDRLLTKTDGRKVLTDRAGNPITP
ncbi:cupin domain-containing protein [Rhizobium sp. PAMB 3182]